MTIKPASLTDLPTLLEFEQEIIEAERPFNSTLKNGEMHFYDLAQLIASDKAQVLVAIVDDEIIGSGYAVIKEEVDAFVTHTQFSYLGFMYVRPAHRGKGVIQAIIEKLNEWAITKGVREIRLQVLDENIVAKKAYEKIGFKGHMLEMRKALC
ncbi:MAG TPA: GNAT family N-acetyltransferase [Ferruginibacter sp.]|nr:GNAT family N-acetyltransferase [Ferruginibacter sp.]